MQLHGIEPEINSLGAKLVVVGNGQPWQAEAFKKEYALSFPLLVDPELKAYRAAGLKRSPIALLHPKTLANGLRATLKGFKNGAVQGDPFQIGGTFVIRPDGKVLFRHVSKQYGDHPDPGDILKALRSV